MDCSNDTGRAALSQDELWLPFPLDPPTSLVGNPLGMSDERVNIIATQQLNPSAWAEESPPIPRQESPTPNAWDSVDWPPVEHQETQEPEAGFDWAGVAAFVKEVDDPTAYLTGVIRNSLKGEQSVELLKAAVTHSLEGGELVGALPGRDCLYWKVIAVYIKLTANKFCQTVVREMVEVFKQEKDPSKLCVEPRDIEKKGLLPTSPRLTPRRRKRKKTKEKAGFTLLGNRPKKKTRQQKKIEKRYRKNLQRFYAASTRALTVLNWKMTPTHFPLPLMILAGATREAIISRFGPKNGAQTLAARMTIHSFLRYGLFPEFARCPEQALRPGASLEEKQLRSVLNTYFRKFLVQLAIEVPIDSELVSRLPHYYGYFQMIHQLRKRASKAIPLNLSTIRLFMDEEIFLGQQSQLYRWTEEQKNSESAG